MKEQCRAEIYQSYPCLFEPRTAGKQCFTLFTDMLYAEATELSVLLELSLEVQSATLMVNNPSLCILDDTKAVKSCIPHFVMVINILDSITAHHLLISLTKPRCSTSCESGQLCDRCPRATQSQSSVLLDRNQTMALVTKPESVR